MRIQEGFSDGLQVVIERSYRPSLSRAIEWRYLTLAGMLAPLIITFGVVRGGWIKFNFMPVVEADNSPSYLTMPQGTPAAVTARMVEHIESAALELAAELEQEQGGQPIRRVMATIGDQPFRTAAGPAALNVGADFSATHLGEVNLELAPAEERDTTSTEVADRWREKVGAIPDAVELTFTSSLFSSGEAIKVELSGPRVDQLREFATRLKEELRSYPGVRDITDSFRAGKQELELVITPEAEAAGLTQADLARQVRQAFYGEEVQRIQRGRDDVKVMVRYADPERSSLSGIEEMRIRTFDGREIPIEEVAEIETGRSYSVINRIDRKRTISVISDIDETIGNASVIVAELKAGFLPNLMGRFPGITYDFGGQEKRTRESLDSIKSGYMLAMMGIFLLLASQFRSYIQPAIIMMAIPFGLIGAILGHLAMGIEFTMVSIFGIVALSGIVVNDSLILIDFINRAVRSGVDIDQAVIESGKARFRPVLLTSVTTIAGLFPLLLERSFQAQFLIPMAVSICFGLLTATILTLLYVPALYLIVQDIINLFSSEKHVVADGGQKSDGSGLKAEFRGQRAEGRGQTAEVGSRKAEVGKWGAGRQRTEVRERKAAAGGQMTEVGSRNSECRPATRTELGMRN